MRKNVFGRQFKRDRNERKALFKGLMSALVLHQRIKTTEEKAKAIKGQIDKVVNRAKKNKDAASLSTYLSSLALKKLISDLSRFSNRSAGYTRIIKLGRRLSDNASMVIMEWVDSESSKLNEEKAAEEIEKPKKEKSQELTKKAKR